MTRVLAAVRVAVVGTVWVLATGCVYYNGVYNAEKSAKRGDARLRRDADAEAQQEFQQSAARAESVLARFPKSTWRPRALYLAGRGAALGGECDKGRSALIEYLSIAPTPSPERDRARVALAVCDVRNADLASARARVDSVIASPHAQLDTETRRQARLWGARAALTQGDLDAVPLYLGTMESSVLPWELVNASVNAREFARAESLLVERARRGDYRDDVVRAVREMGLSEQFVSAERVVTAYDAVRIRASARGTLHYTLGDQLLRVGHDSLARLHLTTARTLASNDTVIDRESLARLTMVDLRRASSLRHMDSVLARVDSATWRTAYGRRLSEPVLLLRMLNSREDGTGATQFLAAEVARDSLRAPRLASGLFAALGRDRGTTPVAPHAWYAASVLEPDSADQWRRKVITEFSFSSVAARLNGQDPASRPDFVSTAELLKFSWSETVRLWNDSLRVLRTVSRPPARTP